MSILISRDDNLKNNYIHFCEASIGNIHVIGQEILREFAEGYRGKYLSRHGPCVRNEGNFVERYGMKMSGSRQKIKLLIVIVVWSK